MFLEKFYNRGWVDYVLLALTLAALGEAMQPRNKPGPIYFIEPPLGHLSGGSMYNLEMVKRLERDALGTSFLHALQSPVSELVQHCKAWPSQCVFVLDGLYLSVPAFKASLQQFLPYVQRTYLMLHYLESMNTYYTARAKAALWAGEQLWLQAVQGIIYLAGNCGSISHGRA